MRPEELFVGAIVKFPHGVDKVVDLPYIEGRGICASFAASATLFPIDPKLLVPVEITTAILEQDGWETKGRIVWYKKGPIRLGWYPSNKSLITGYYTFPQAVCYVHQLMAIQRLLGLEEIKL